MTGDPFECRCVLCHDYGARGEADQMDLAINSNVQQHGWHVVMVPEDEVGPRFAYTIGLAHTHGGPELAMFGLDIHAMHRMLNILGDRAAAGCVLENGQEHHDTSSCATLTTPGSPSSRHRRTGTGEDFVARPTWAHAFTNAGFTVLTSERLATPLSDVDTSVLTQGEWREVHFHGITTLGGVLFNTWD